MAVELALCDSAPGLRDETEATKVEFPSATVIFHSGHGQANNVLQNFQREKGEHVGEGDSLRDVTAERVSYRKEQLTAVNVT